MGRQENDRQVHVTMTSEERDELEKFCSKNNMSINEAMNRARELLVVEAFGNRLPEMAATIEEFRVNADNLFILFRHVLEYAADSKKIAEADVKGQLEGMALIAESNLALKDEVSKITKEKNEVEIQLVKAKKEIDVLEKQLADIIVDQDEIIELRNKVVELSETIISIKADYVEKIEKVQEENFAKILEVVKASQPVN